MIKSNHQGSGSSSSHDTKHDTGGSGHPKSGSGQSKTDSSGDKDRKNASERSGSHRKPDAENLQK